VTDEVDGGDVDSEFAGDLQHGPGLALVEVEDLEVLRRHAAGEPGEGGVEHVAMPFLVPGGVDIGAVGQALDRGGAVVVRHRGAAAAAFVGFAGAEFVGDAPAREVEQPAAERAARRIGLELVHGLRHALEDILRDFLGVGVAQAGAPGETVDELVVEPIELGPARLVFPVAQAEQQRGAGAQCGRSGRIGGRAVQGHVGGTPFCATIFQMPPSPARSRTGPPCKRRIPMSDKALFLAIPRASLPGVGHVRCAGTPC